jgi:integrase
MGVGPRGLPQARSTAARRTWARTRSETRQRGAIESFAKGGGLHRRGPPARRAPSKFASTPIWLRLLLFTGARLREILHLKWENVDLERGLLFLADSKAGRKTLVLNAPAMAVLVSLPRVGSYVIAGDTAGTKGEKPRADLKRPWRTIAKRAGLDGVRLHDLRHTYASFGAGGGLGLPIIGKLLGQTQASTTQRYAHLDNDPLRRATNPSEAGSRRPWTANEAPRWLR